MKTVFALVFFFGFKVFAGCISSDRAAEIGAQLFLAEHNVKVTSEVFDQEFHLMFHYDNYDATLEGALKAFFDVAYDFNEEKQRHEFISYLDRSRYHHTTGYVYVSCTGEVSTVTYTEHD